jgi:hypothetical protein
MISSSRNRTVTVADFPTPELPINGPLVVDVSGIITMFFRNSCEKIAGV